MNEVRLHIATLVGAGWSQRAIAGESGIAPTTVNLIARGIEDAPPHAARAILAVDPGTIPSKASTQVTEPFVPRVGTVRRIQALLAIGWTHDHITAATKRHGCSTRSATTLHQQGRWVTRSTHDAYAAAYRDLAMRPGPSERTRQRAAKRGYVGPMDWHDIDHDEAPEVEVVAEDVTYLDEAAIQRRLGGDRTIRLRNGEAAEVVRRAIRSGMTTGDVERDLGLKPERYGTVEELRGGAA